MFIRLRSKSVRLIMLILIVGVICSSCDDADIANRNLSKAADNFEVVQSL